MKNGIVINHENGSFRKLNMPFLSEYERQHILVSYSLKEHCKRIMNIRFIECKTEKRIFKKLRFVNRF